MKLATVNDEDMHAAMMLISLCKVGFQDCYKDG